MERQVYVFKKILAILRKEISVTDKDEARDLFFSLTARFKNWNSSKWESDDFKKIEEQISEFLRS